MSERKNIALINCGGTAAYRRLINPDGTQAQLEPLPAADIAERLHPDLQRRCNITPFDFWPTINSSDITMRNLIELSWFLRNKIIGQFDGVAVIHGANTPEQTGSYIDYSMGRGSRIPKVFIAGLRHHDREGSDSQENVESGIRILRAAAMESVNEVMIYDGKGNLAAVKAVGAVKRTDNALHMYDSPNMPYVAKLTAHQVEIAKSARRVDPEIPFEFRPNSVEGGVHVFQVMSDFDPRLIEASVNLGHHAVILGVYEHGNLPTKLLDPIERATARGMKVILTTQFSEHSLAKHMPVEETNGLSVGALTVAGNLSRAALLMKVKWLLGNPDVVDKLGGFQAALDTNLVGELPENPYVLIQ